jgi:hypothetical protein
VSDLLGRLFDPDQLDVAWCGAVTFIPTDEGWLDLASVLDLASGTRGRRNTALLE